MTTKQEKDKADNKKSIDSVIARVAGAVQVAGIAVSATMAIKDDALDEINTMKSQSNKKEGRKAIKKITRDTKNLKGVNNI